MGNNVDINKDAVLACGGFAGPIVMVNIYRQKDKGRFDAFMIDMRRAAARAITSLPAETVYAGAIRCEFVAGEDYWDTMVLVRYPDWPTLRALVTNDALIEALNEVRRTYLDDARFILTTALDATIPQSLESLQRST